MRSIDDFSRQELVDLLNRCWMTHDGMWFAHSLRNSGIEMTNRLNRSAIRSLAEIELKRIRAMLVGDEEIDTVASFKRFFMAASDLVIPDFMNVQWTYLEPNCIGWEFNQEMCFAYRGVKRLGILDDYECGVLYRIQCWLEILGMEHTFEPQFHRCLMHTRGKCAGTIRLYD